MYRTVVASSGDVLRQFAIGLFILACLPVVLIGLALFLPSAWHNQLVFTFDDPNVVTAWTTAFLHSSDLHLRANLEGYPLAVVPLTVFYSLRNRLTTLLAISVSVILVTPLVTATIDYLIGYHWLELFTDDTTSQGFSGIVGAFGGALFASVASFLYERYGAEAAIQGGGLLMMVTLTVLSYATGILRPQIILALLLGYGIILWSIVREGLFHLATVREAVVENPVTISAGLLCGACFVVVVVSLLPVDVIQDGAFVNIISHTTGLIFGMIVTFLIERFYNRSSSYGSVP